MKTGHGAYSVTGFDSALRADFVTRFWLSCILEFVIDKRGSERNPV